MTEQSNINSETVLVALDIAKKSHDAVVLMPNGKRYFTKVANSHLYPVSTSWTKLAI